MASRQTSKLEAMTERVFAQLNNVGDIDPGEPYFIAAAHARALVVMCANRAESLEELEFGLKRLFKALRSDARKAFARNNDGEG